MAVNNKIGKHTTVVLIIIVVCFISILCCGVLSSCCEVEDSNSQNSVLKQVTINDTEKIKVIASGGMSFTFIKFNYEGHEYFSIPYNDYYMMHSPNCSCLKESKVESSSIFDSSPSNSLFDW